MKVFSFPFFIIFFAFFCVFEGFSQKAWQDETIKFYDGLPSDIILKTISDSKGFLYVSTPKGLSRYDGYRFVNQPKIHSPVHSFYCKNDKFYIHDGATGLFVLDQFQSDMKIIVRNNYEDVDPDNDHFNNIFVDSKQRIWCSDFNYVKYFSENSTRTQQFRIHSNNKSNEEPVTFMEPTPGTIWAFTAKGLFVWNEKTQKLQPHPNDLIGRESYLKAVLLDGSNVLMITSKGKIQEFNIKTSKLTAWSDFSAETIINAGSFHDGKKETVFIYSRDRIFIVGENGTYREMYHIEKAQINEVYADVLSGMLWVASTKGLVKLALVDAVENIELPIKPETNNPVLSINQDSRNAIWLTDKNNNVWCYTTAKQWKKFAVPFGTNVNRVDVYRDQVFVSSDNGLFRIVSESLQKIKLPDLPGKAIIKKCVLTKNNELWLLCKGIPIQRYVWPTLQKVEKPFANDPVYWTGNSWNDIIENTDGKIWIAGWTPKDYGMNYYDVSKNKFIDIAELPSNKDRNKFFGDYNNRIALAGQNGLLFSGYGGFNKVESNGDISKKVDINSYPIANGRIEGIGQDNHGNIVFATADGLHIYSPPNDKVIRISQIDGLPSDDLIYGFKKLSNQTFALGTDNGFAAVDIQKLLEPKTTGRLELCTIKIDGLARSFNGKTIELSKDETDLSLYFSTLSFTDKQKIFYRYKFKDDKHWNILGNNPELSLNHIAPGHYEITIQAGNHFGQWQSKQLEFDIVAHPPFYKSNGFYLLMCLLIVLIVIVVNRYLLLRQRKEADYRQKLKEAEMLTLRTQMNPHFMFNTLNSINSFIIENKREAASGYLTTFSKLMRSILEFSKEAFISLDDEIRTLGLYLQLEAVRLEHSFDYTIKVDPDLKDEIIMIPPLILQPFVENSIWHGLRHKQEQGNLFITFSKKEERYLKIRIEDDGIGRKAAGAMKKNQTHHKSYGIEITIQRLEMLNPQNAVEIIDLTNTQGNSLGTAVEITIIL